MCCGVLAVLPEMSTWCDKPMPAPWPSQAWKCGGAALHRTGSQEHATVTTTADGLPGCYHLVQGG